jgi:hypothetical protein
MPATNRTQYSLELLTLYAGEGGGGFAVFDWSCMPDYPCQDLGTGQIHTGPHYVLSVPLKSAGFACYLSGLTWLAGDDWHRWIFYRNTTKKLDQNSPPLWENQALLYNYCAQRWDLIYAHQYRVHQKNCALEGGCRSWGPIIEKHPPAWKPDTTPISAVGFYDSMLDLPGVGLVPLSSENSSWTEALPGWRVISWNEGLWRWKRGAYLDSDQDGAWDHVDADDDNDGYSDEVESGAPLCLNAVNDDNFDDPYVNDGCPAVGEPETYARCTNGVDDDGDGVINDGCPAIGLYSEGEFRIGTSSLGTCRNYQGLPPPNPRWPSDFVFGGVPHSSNRVTLTDLTSFLGPVRRLHSSPGQAEFQFPMGPAAGQRDPAHVDQYQRPDGPVGRRHG